MRLKIHAIWCGLVLVSCGQIEPSKPHPPQVEDSQADEASPAQFALNGGLASRMFRRRPSSPPGPQPTTEILDWNSSDLLRTPVRLFYQGRPKLITANRAEFQAASEVNILVHGNNLAGPTLAGKMAWNHPNSKSYQAIEATGGKNVTFLWSGANGTSDRRSAGIVLGRNIFDLAGTGKTVNIWAHSHGGNVTREAIKEFDRLASLYQRSTGISLTMGRVVTIAAPFRPEHDIPGYRTRGPLQRVRYYANVGAAQDWVVKWGGNLNQIRQWSASPFDYRADARYKVAGSHNTVIFTQKRLEAVFASLQSDPYF